MAAMAEMKVTLDPEVKAAIEGLTEQIKALRDLLETKAGTESHYQQAQCRCPTQFHTRHKGSNA